MVIFTDYDSIFQKVIFYFLLAMDIAIDVIIVECVWLE